MDPRAYRQWSPSVRKGGRVVPCLGLFINVDPNYAEKAVPIIGEEKKESSAPKLVMPGAAPKPSAKILTPGAPQQPSSKLITPGAKPKAEAGLVSPKGEPVSAPQHEVFQGTVPRPKFQAPTTRKLGGGLVTPGPQPKPSAKLVVPGASSRPSGGLATTPHSGSTQSGIVDPHGRSVSSRLTEGPGAARPTPKLSIPGEGPAKTSGSLVAPTGVVGGRGEQRTAGAETMQRMDQDKQQAEQQAKTKLAEQTEQKFMDGGTAGPKKPDGKLAKPETGKQAKQNTGPRISGPNITGSLAAGAMYSNLAAPLSAVAMDAAGGLQGLTSTGTRHERDRDVRTGIAQRHEMVRQGDMAARATQSSMLKRSQTAREDSVHVRPGLRLYVNG